VFQVIRQLVDDDEGEDDDDIEDVLDGFVSVKLDEFESQRYHKPRRQYRKPRSGCFEDDLDEGTSEEQPWLNDDEFLQKYGFTFAFDFAAIHYVQPIQVA
jgi:hypothetical protein